MEWDIYMIKKILHTLVLLAIGIPYFLNYDSNPWSLPVAQKSDYSRTYAEAFWNGNWKMDFQHTICLLIYYFLSIQTELET